MYLNLNGDMFLNRVSLYLAILLGILVIHLNLEMMQELKSHLRLKEEKDLEESKVSSVFEKYDMNKNRKRLLHFIMF